MRVKHLNMILAAMKVDDMAKAKTFAKDPGLKKATCKRLIATRPPFTHQIYHDDLPGHRDHRHGSPVQLNIHGQRLGYLAKKHLKNTGKKGYYNGLKARAYGYDVDDNHQSNDCNSHNRYSES